MNKNILIGIVVVIIVIAGIAVWTLNKPFVFSLSSVVPTSVSQTQSEQQNKTFSDSSLGFSFSYPNNFSLEKQSVPANEDFALACPAIEVVGLTDPNGKLISYEASGPIVSAPINFEVRKANCNANIQDNLSNNQKALSQKLSSSNFSKQMVDALIATMEGYGNPILDANGLPLPNGKATWVDSCDKFEIVGDVNHPMIIESECRSGYPNGSDTIITWPISKNNTMVKMSYNKKFFNNDDIQTIISSFSLIK